MTRKSLLKIVRQASISLIGLGLSSCVAPQAPQNETNAAPSKSLEENFNDTYQKQLAAYLQISNHKAMFFAHTTLKQLFISNNKPAISAVAARQSQRKACEDVLNQLLQENPAQILHPCTEINEDQRYVAPGWFADLLHPPPSTASEQPETSSSNQDQESSEDSNTGTGAIVLPGGLGGAVSPSLRGGMASRVSGINQIMQGLQSSPSGVGQSTRTSTPAVRCPPPMVSRGASDGESNRTWIQVNNSCGRNVTVTIHTISFYPGITPSRVERTINSDIGSSATFYCDGKQQGCVVQMLGYHQTPD